MSIEVHSAPKGVNASAGADSHGKKAGKASVATGDGSNGFSALMNLLSAAEDGAAGLAADTSLANAPLAETKDGLSVDVTAAGVEAALLLQPFAAPASAAVAASAVAAAAASASVSAPAVAALAAPAPATPAPAPVLTTAITDILVPIALAQQPVGGAMPLPAVDAVGLPVKEVKELSFPSGESIGLPGKAGQQTKVSDTGTPLKSLPAGTANDAPRVNIASAQAAADLTQASPVSALLAHKSAVQAQTHNAIAQDSREARGPASLQSVVSTTDAATALLAGGQSDLVRPLGRFGARSGSGQSGSSGFEGAFGQAMAATNRSESVFEVPPASAVVPDTAVAETVSYWASHGVQTAELMLDGFGDAPVEVSILLNGDQAQIDFRTDQAGVRQVLENAAVQLKDMLSSQGLQLAGVSVGSSGMGGDAGGDRHQRPAAQQITLVKTEAVGVSGGRAANPAVGRSLDLFV